MKILFFNVPAYGHINATLPVVNELVGRGHTVIYYCTEQFHPVIEKSGATYRDYPNAIPSSKAIAEKAHNLVNISQMLVSASLTLTPFVVQEIENEKPDLLMYDSINLWARIGALATNTPAIATFAVMILEGIQGIFDTRTLLYTVASALPKVPQLMWNRAKLVRQFGADSVQFPLFPSVGQLNLVFMSRSFQMDTPFIDDSFRFVGASINPALRDQTPLTNIPTRKPLIYVSLGTVNNMNLSFYRRIFEAFNNYPAQFILSAGKLIDMAHLNPIPENFLVMDSVPQLEILQHADLFITHGGMNSIQESLFYGVPQIVVPQQLEQAINGRRVHQLGAGIVIGEKPPFGNVSSQTLYNTVQTVLQNSSFKQQAQHHSDLSRRAGGYIKAVDEIEAFSIKLLTIATV